jgi:hypothetical protein
MEGAMSLPIDIAGSLWLTVREIWEWEANPAPPPDTSDSGTLSDWTAGCDPSPGADWRLVFKGYEYEHSYLWSIADSPLSRPWLHQQDDDAEPKPLEPTPLEAPRSPLDAATKTPDDADPPA